TEPVVHPGPFDRCSRLRLQSARFSLFLFSVDAIRAYRAIGLVVAHSTSSKRQPVLLSRAVPSQLPQTTLSHSSNNQSSLSFAGLGREPSRGFVIPNLGADFSWRPGYEGQRG